MDILDEARESLKEEKIQAFLKKNYKNMLLIVAIFITTLSLGIWWNQHSRELIHRDGGEYMMAVLKMRSYNPDEAVAKFNEIKDNKSVYSVMADLNLAAFHSYKNKHDLALESYKHIKSSRSTPKPFGDLACLMKIKTQMSMDDVEPQKVVNKLENYVSEDRIFKASAQELLLAMYLKQNDMDNAKKVFQQLSTDINVPRAIRDRVSQMQTLINL